MTTISTLTAYIIPDKIWLKVVGYLFVGYTVVGVSALNNGRMHWFSDAIAACFLGYAIGSNVGQSFRQSISNQPIDNRSKHYILSILGMEYAGLAYVYNF